MPSPASVPTKRPPVCSWPTSCARSSSRFFAAEAAVTRHREARRRGVYCVGRVEFYSHQFCLPANPASFASGGMLDVTDGFASVGGAPLGRSADVAHCPVVDIRSSIDTRRCAPHRGAMNLLARRRCSMRTTSHTHPTPRSDVIALGSYRNSCDTSYASIGFM